MASCADLRSLAERPPYGRPAQNCVGTNPSPPTCPTSIAAVPHGVMLNPGPWPILAPSSSKSHGRVTGSDHEALPALVSSIFACRRDQLCSPFRRWAHGPASFPAFVGPPAFLPSSPPFIGNHLGLNKSKSCHHHRHRHRHRLRYRHRRRPSVGHRE